jgi:hypothetical protein
MGGAATALTLARLIMEAGLDLRLRTVIPIVENAISGSRPLSIRRLYEQLRLRLKRWRNMVFRLHVAMVCPNPFA